jgi:hypothetical protein
MTDGETGLAHDTRADNTPEPDAPIPLDYARPDIRPVVIAIFPQQWMAAAAHLALVNDGFRADVIDHTPRSGFGTAEVLLLVPDDQADDALTRLRTTPAKPYLVVPKKIR